MKTQILKEGYRLLFKKFGPQHWWPAKTQFEVMVGAVLTQNTNWKNVEKAIANLKKVSCLTPDAIDNYGHARLATLIKPAGYYNVKAKRLKNFVRSYVNDFGGKAANLKKLPVEKSREWLLSINGVGKETADSILLYALDKPVFVVDAYTKRILERHGLVPGEVTYDEVQDIFTDNLEKDVKLFNEYHALIVMTAKNYCRKTPKCNECPLNGWNR